MKSNIFGGAGYLTEEQRKESLIRSLSYSTIETNIDLSKPLKIVPYGYGKMTVKQFGIDVACFIAFWEREVARDLNGFPGLDTIKFDLTEVDLV